MTDQLRASVIDALNNADEGGYRDFVRHNSVTLVALDLYDSDDEISALLADADPNDIGNILSPLIIEWRKSRNQQRCPDCDTPMLPDSLFPGSGPVCEKCGWGPNLGEKS